MNNSNYFNNELSDLKHLNATAETTVEHNTSNSNKSGSTHDNENENEYQDNYNPHETN